jgi:cysteine desulfurase
MVAAAELATSDIDVEQRRLARLRDRLWEGIGAVYPSAILNGDPGARLANTLNVSFPGLDGEILLINLDLAGICASSGAACMVGSIAPSHVLLAMGAEPAMARASVRFSLGKQTTADEIELAIVSLEEIFSRLEVASA